jgi:hypothetical protein
VRGNKTTIRGAGYGGIYGKEKMAPKEMASDCRESEMSDLAILSATAGKPGAMPVCLTDARHFVPKTISHAGDPMIGSDALSFIREAGR